MNTYAEDIHTHLRCKESNRFKFKGYPEKLRHRPKMIANLVRICQEKKYCSAVQHLAAYLLDIFVDNHRVVEIHSELILVTCIILAAKLEDQDKMPPKFSDFKTFLPLNYKATECLEIEVSILSFFKWDIMFPTVPHFAEYYVLFALLPNDALNGKPLTSYKDLNVVAVKYVEYFLDVVLQDHEYLKFYPSVVAASCIACTRRCLTIRPVWPETLKCVTLYDYSDIESCVEFLLKALDEDMVKHQKEEHTKQKETSTKQKETSTKRRETSILQKELSIVQKETSNKLKEPSTKQKEVKVFAEPYKRKLSCSDFLSTKIIKK